MDTTYLCSSRSIYILYTRIIIILYYFVSTAKQTRRLGTGMIFFFDQVDLKQFLITVHNIIIKTVLLTVVIPYFF